ncbi:MAG: DUF4082 domain-containing protein [Bryobacteraceae bacterium]|nr:DUF4082 domain-containing protein [Bryobacteraceae bacterium]
MNRIPVLACLFAGAAVNVLWAQSAVSLWPATARPVMYESAPDPNAVEVGVRFRASQSGLIRGVRFYKGATNTGTHHGRVWSAGGGQLATAVFTNETASGWQQVLFSQPVPVTAGTLYVASVFMPNGNYAFDADYFLVPRQSGPLYAPAATGAEGPNGVYRFGAPGGFPSLTHRAANFWVDVIFEADGQTSLCPACLNLFGNSTPSIVLTNDPLPLEVGVRFRSDQAGVIRGIRFYKSTANTGSHIGTLWTDSGTQLARATFVSESASGWQEVLFSNPVSISANTHYVASYYAPNGNYSASLQYFNVNRGDGPLRAPADLAGAPNGLYRRAGSPTFPTDTYQAANYWVDVLFEPQQQQPPPPTPCTGCFSLLSGTPQIDAADPLPVELGVRFRASSAGAILGIRFYKASGNTGTHIGNLWTEGGALLGRATFSGETASGWQQVLFSQPVPVTANTAYVASYYAPNGRYSADLDYFAVSRTNGPLTAPADAPGAANGLYRRASSSVFPAETFRSANYWVDVLFVPSSGNGDVDPPVLSTPTVTAGPAGAVLSWTTNEPSTTEVDYGLTNSYGTTASNRTLTTAHSITLTGLTWKSTYHFRIRSADAAGNAALSSNLTLETTRPGPSLVSVNGRQLIVQRRNPDGTLAPAAPFRALGVGYSPASRDTNTNKDDPNNAEIRRAEFSRHYRTDVPLLKELGVNTVRLFLDPGFGPDGLLMLDEFYRNGIMVVMTADDAINNVTRVQQVVNYYKEHPAILMFSLGSEWNVWKYFNNNLTVQQAAELTQQAAALIKSLDPNHPVTTSYGDIDDPAHGTPLSVTSGFVNTTCPSVDVWSVNAYRGRTFTNLFGQWASISGKPLFLGEFGIDAFDAQANAVNEAAQADWNLSLFDDLMRNLSAADPAKTAIGGTVFVFADEWWKVTPPGAQQAGGWTAPFPDGRADEEYFGLLTVDRAPRLAFHTLKRVFVPGYVPPPRGITYQLLSRGNTAAMQAGQLSLARFTQDGVTLFEKTGGGGGGRGFNVAAIEAATGRVLEPGRNFDTWLTRNTGEAMTAMVNYIDSLPNNTLLLIAVADEAGLNPDRSCVPFASAWTGRGLQTLEALGSREIRNYCFWDSWAMAAVKGEGVARAEQLRKVTDASVQVNITVP